LTKIFEKLLLKTTNSLNHMKKPYLIAILLVLIAPLASSVLANSSESQSSNQRPGRELQRLFYPFRFNPDQRPPGPGDHDFGLANELQKAFNNSRDEIVGRYAGSALWSGMKDIAYADGIAYCVVEYGLVIVDVSNPGLPVYISQLKLPMAETWSIVLSEAYAYITNGSNGLQAVDISDPYNPILDDAYATDGYAVDVKIRGDYSYIADGYSGLTIIDLVGNMSVGGYVTPDAALALAISGDQAIIACGDGGLQIVNISDPQNPFLSSSLDTLGRVYDVDVMGKYVYAACGESDLKIIDISDPETPLLRSRSTIPGGADAVTVRGDYAYVTYGSPYGLQVIDIADPDLPHLRGSLNIAGTSLGMAIDGDYAYVAGWQSGLQVINIADPEQIYLKGSYSPPGALFNLALAGDFVYVSGTDRNENKGTLRILDISDRNNPRETGAYIADGPVADVQVSGDYAFLAAIDEGLLILNIADPENPYSIGGINTPGYALELAIDGEYIYVADDSSGLQIIAIANPLNPVIAGRYPTEGSCVDAEIVGDRAFIVDIDNGLRILNVSDRNDPILEGGFDISGRARAVAVDGDYAYLCGEEFGLAILDLTDPVNPAQLSVLPIDGSAVSIEIRNNYAFITDIHYGLQIIDIYDPEMPYLAGYFATDGYAWDVELVDNYALIADYFGLLIISLERPEITYAPDSFYFEAYQDGQPPLAQNVMVENSGAGNLNWTISCRQTWLSLSPISATAPSQISVQISLEGLLEGLYHDTITIAAKASNSPQLIPVQLYLKPPNHQPVLAEIGAKSVDENGDLVLAISASDIDGTIPTLCAENLPANSSFSDHGDGNGTFVFNPDYTQAGEYQIYFYAYDALDKELLDSETVVITVNNVNRTPAFISDLADTIIVEDEIFELIVQASDPDNDQLVISCYSKPESAVFHDSLNGVGFLQFAPDFNDVDNNYLLGIEVSDSEGAKTRDSLTLSVVNRQLEVTNVQASSPQTGVLDILIDDSIQIVFNEGIAEENLDDLLALSSAKGDELIFSYNSGLHSIFVKSGADYLTPLDTIFIILSADITDLAGYKLGKDISHVLYIGAAVYSGDTNNDGIVDERDILPLGLYWESSGPIRNEIPNCIWEMEPAHLWEPLEATYADVDGSGLVGAADICGVAENWGSSRENEFTKNQNLKSSLSEVGPDVLIELYEGLNNCPDSDGKKILKAALESLIGGSSANLPQTPELYQNYPNPFNPATNIRFYLSRAGQATLSIYNIRGQRVTVLLDGYYDSGFYEVSWDGLDDSGRPSASGIYLYRLISGKNTLTRRMILLK
jgi:hypothetical protein